MNGEQLKLNVQLTPLENGTYPDVVIREGEAPPNPKLKRKFAKQVMIASIAAYCAVRYMGMTPHATENKGVVLFSVNPDAPSLTFEENPNDEDATTLNAELKISDEFRTFAINKDKYFTQKELETLVKKYAYCFGSVDTAKDLLERLRNFEVKFEQQVTKADDRQGAKADNFKQNINFVKGELPKSLELKMPVYDGQPAQNMTVEIEIEKGAGNLPTFGFYSLALGETNREHAKKLINDEVAKLNTMFVCIEKA